MSFKTSIKQYGLFNSLKRLIKMILRKLGFHYESFWCFVNTMDINAIEQKMQKYSYDGVRELSINDFENGDYEIFNKKKLHLIHKRFESGEYWSFGIVENTKLVYSCWITTKQINFPAKFKKSISLNYNEGFLEDAYCHPDFRGKGLHSKMNLFRLLQLHKLGKEKSIVIVLSENIPAIKSQIKCGFKKEKQIIFITVFNKSYFIEKLS